MGVAVGSEKWEVDVWARVFGMECSKWLGRGKWMRGRQCVGFGALVLEGSGVGSECVSVEVWDGVQRKVGVWMRGSGCIGWSAAEQSPTQQLRRACGMCGFRGLGRGKWMCECEYVGWSAAVGWGVDAWEPVGVWDGVQQSAGAYAGHAGCGMCAFGLQRKVGVWIRGSLWVYGMGCSRALGPTQGVRDVGCAHLDVHCTGLRHGRAGRGMWLWEHGVIVVAG